MMFIGRAVQKVLKEWGDESRNPHLCLYRRDGDTITIYTDRPGCMIGKGGQLVDKYRKKISEASFGNIKNVSFVQTYGIF